MSDDSDDLSSKTKTVADPWDGAVDHAHAAEAALGGQDDLFGPGGVIDIQSPARIAEIIDKNSQPTIAELLSGSPWRGGNFDLDIAEFARLILLDKDLIHSA
ncbi:hypothetical protein, partial [Acidocella sp.]|uniref:hypothetical protein n=1 Tax=Acidocella sp. TaxID=50710 RepID=UPI0017B6CEC2